MMVDTTLRPGNRTRDDVVAASRRWIGTPYRHQASILGAGCDCLGLVRGVWRELYGAEPETPGAYSPDWAEAGASEQLAEAAFRHFVPVSGKSFERGDLLLFRRRAGVAAKHLAIATGTASMVHAHDGAVVCEIAIPLWWRRRIAYVFSFPGIAPR